MRYWLGKRGLEREYIIGGIIALVVFGIITFWTVNKVVPLTYEQNERAACRTSIDVNSERLEVLGVDVVGQLMDVNCKTIKKEIKGDTREAIFGQLADMMAMAWQDFRRGEKKIFEDDTAVFCMPRYAPITFEEKNKVYPNLYAYLANEKPIGMEETYAEFLMNKPLTKDEYDTFVATPDFINTNKDYAVIFVLGKTFPIDKFWNAVLSAVVGTVVVGGVITLSVVTLGVAIPAAGAIIPAVLLPIGSTSTAVLTPLMIKSLLVTGALGGGALGFDWLGIQQVDDILEEDLSTTYNIGAVRGDNYFAQLYLIPYEDIAKLDCDELKLNRYS